MVSFGCRQSQGPTFCLDKNFFQHLLKYSGLYFPMRCNFPMVPMWLARPYSCGVRPCVACGLPNRRMRSVDLAKLDFNARKVSSFPLDRVRPKTSRIVQRIFRSEHRGQVSCAMSALGQKPTLPRTVELVRLVPKADPHSPKFRERARYLKTTSFRQDKPYCTVSGVGAYRNGLKSRMFTPRYR
jgi:hypothetical protein